jgi:hypothetical protein
LAKFFASSTGSAWAFKSHHGEAGDDGSGGLSV